MGIYAGKQTLVAAIIVTLTAVFLSVVAGWFSVIGMMALFSATAPSVCIMMVGLETAKIVASCCLKYCEWLARPLKIYLALSVSVLMTITALGVYGHLAKGHLEQTAPMAPIQLQINQKQAQMDQLKGQLASLTAEQQQSDAAVAGVLRNSQTARDAQRGLRAQNQAAGQRKQIQSQIDAINAQMNTISQSMVPLQMQVADVQTKLGPLQYVADLFGWKDPEVAVRMIILLLMFAFDPLAIVLMIVGTNIWGRWLDQRRPVDKPVEDAPEPESIAPQESIGEPEPVRFREAPPEAVADESEPEDPAVEKEFSEFVDKLKEHRKRSLGEETFEAADVPLTPSPNPGSWAFVHEPDEPVSPFEISRYADGRVVVPTIPEPAAEPEIVPEPEPPLPEPAREPAPEPAPEPAKGKPTKWVFDGNRLVPAPPKDSILPELEAMLEKKSDAEAIIKLIEENPELTDEVANLLADNPDLLAEIERAAAEKDRK